MFPFSNLLAVLTCCLLDSALPVTIDEIKKYNPEFFKDGWTPPSQYASLHEQKVKRGIRPSLSKTVVNDESHRLVSHHSPVEKKKKLAILVNEGTASSAEVFASSLHDNSRTVVLVGAKTYGKGLIQHTFPTQDGGGLRLTVGKLVPKCCFSFISACSCTSPLTKLHQHLFIVNS